MHASIVNTYCYYYHYYYYYRVSRRRSAPSGPRRPAARTAPRTCASEYPSRTGFTTTTTTTNSSTTNTNTYTINDTNLAARRAPRTLASEKSWGSERDKQGQH